MLEVLKTSITFVYWLFSHNFKMYVKNLHNSVFGFLIFILYNIFFLFDSRVEIAKALITQVIQGRSGEVRNAALDNIAKLTNGFDHLISKLNTLPPMWRKNSVPKSISPTTTEISTLKNRQKTKLGLQIRKADYRQSRTVSTTVGSTYGVYFY